MRSKERKAATLSLANQKA